ncbi:MAG: F0F1 ATP synthase subunit A [Firmicutes bacterium]|nr:F0F1 ATP synthase subunit A [Bacillota bacterium]
MEPNVVFYIKSFPVSEPILWTWIIMAVLGITCFLLTRNLQKIPKGSQHFLEVAVEGIEKLVANDLGPDGKVFVPLILMVAAYVFISNLIGVIPGGYSPTGDLTTTIALAVLIYVLGTIGAIRKNGFKSWIKGFFEPYWILFPINIAGEISQVVSHSFRLYGNIFGGGILLGIVYMLLPYVIPVPLMAWFGVLMGAIQAAVFTMLATAYIQLKIG